MDHPSPFVAHELHAARALRGNAEGALVLLVALHVAVSAISFRGLPPRIPTHFGLTGEADAFGAPDPGVWFLLAGLATALGLVFLIVGRLVPRASLENVNMPRKDDLLALPAELQSAVMVRLAAHLVITGALIVLSFLLVQIAVALAAHGITRTFLFWLPLFGLVPAVIQPFWLIALVGRAIDAARRTAGHA